MTRVVIEFGHVLGIDIYRAEKIGFDIEMLDKFIIVVFTSAIQLNRSKAMWVIATIRLELLSMIESNGLSGLFGIYLYLIALANMRWTFNFLIIFFVNIQCCRYFKILVIIC